MTTTTKAPPDDMTSYTDVGQDAERAGVYANIVPVALRDGQGKWSFWFGKRPGQRQVHPVLVIILSTIGDVFIVRYSSDGNPMSVHHNGKRYDVDRPGLLDMMRERGVLK